MAVGGKAELEQEQQLRSSTDDGSVVPVPDKELASLLHRLRPVQLAPGGSVHFIKCTLQEAGEARHAAQERFRAVIQAIAWKHGS